MPELARAVRAVPDFGSAALDLRNADLHDPGLQIEDEQFLLRAFRSFAEAAGSLEHSYGLLRAEVERLRRELESSNSDLALSLEENRGMRVHLDRILEWLTLRRDGGRKRWSDFAGKSRGAASAGVARADGAQGPAYLYFDPAALCFSFSRAPARARANRNGTYPRRPWFHALAGGAACPDHR